jgi:hypothetical protein
MEEGNFWAHSHSRDRLLLASSLQPVCLSVCLFAFISAVPTGHFLKILILVTYESLPSKSQLGYHKTIWSLYMNTSVRFIVAGAINGHKRIVVQHSVFLYC